MVISFGSPLHGGNMKGDIFEGRDGLAGMGAGVQTLELVSCRWEVGRGGGAAVGAAV